MTLPILSGLREIAADYDGLILDVWGVLHDGSAPYPGVLDALARLKEAGKRRVVLSNAPRRAALVVRRMTEIGIAPELYDGIHTSGEEAWQHLKRRDDPFFAALGRRCYLIGPPRDDSVIDGLELERVARIEDAEFIFNVGPWGWDDTVEAYEAVLAWGAHHDLAMVCANADLVVMHQGRLVLCAGALAQRYEALGGRVRWHGKPLPSVYEACFALLGIADRRRVLAVGDSLRTDIAGANAAGIDSLLVAGGIHAAEFGAGEEEIADASRVLAAIVETEYRPSAAIARFRW